ncbi:LysR family transcriptional regulator [Vagococcus acidifermentans]|uniref:HTH lysR-type domain-containing protein n=1 Tax=Vagococcus acidifermentans TaxID=564710 RepID=A0A430AWX3_9ENTE|nr:LysR family transcriptional regulator [Vagococcus acidifermentans]RSU12554.1 hypothetical protein CBF27_06160 [Vagococcus acidifermentans]
MTIDKIKMFLAICTEGTASKAALSLHITQPAITQGIKDLEAALQTKLFHRIGRQLILSDNGYKFLDHAKIIIQAYDDAFYEFTHAAIHLRIGSSLTIAAYLLADMIQAYEHDTNASVDVYCNNMKTIQEKMANNELDIAFIEGSIDERDYSYYPLGEFDLHFVASPTYMARRKDLPSDAYLIRERGSTYRRLIDSYFQEEQISAYKKWESSSNGALKQAALCHQGIALLPQEAIADAVKENKLVILKLTDKTFKKKYGMIVKTIKKDDYRVQSFLKFMMRGMEE